MGNKRNRRGKKKTEEMDTRADCDWSGLPMDVLGLIARRLAAMMEDLMAFRGVCTSWRSAAPKDALLPPVSKVPLLMVPQKRFASHCEFYSLYKRQICMRIPLPQANDMRCIDVGFGWVLALAKTRGTVFLFKPLSSAPKIELPSYKKFPEFSKYRDATNLYFITRGMLTANPSETPDFMLLVNTNDRVGSGVWKNGDRNWMEIPAPVQYTVVRRNGMICTVCCTEAPWIEIRDPHSSDFPKAVTKKLVLNGLGVLHTLDAFYVVESTDGDVLLVTRHYAAGGFAEGGKRFSVMRVDIEKGIFEEMENLGKDAVFVGNNAAVSVDATEFPHVLEPGCIYFSGDYGTRYHESWPYDDEDGQYNVVDDMGIYNVEDQTTQTFDVESHCFICPPLWIFPSFSKV